ncbi:Rab-GTPase-TBC domain superfamily [Arabidopsis thaliana x Arabidopsis arenosa]|uniref:Rab-GTPase-TBC domain superfamily n=1 Tax=Arabidopsis thaliana x Arabidopsis arenosa TaxID=1240361 RepID=A0A8T2AXH3_9BRAS|nr:Rab-GTPase-TBC domain superfamily [Arabidopsis thaliana x Arabidopsis arenosa]
MEEETERAEKWKNFLDRQENRAAESYSSEEEFQDSFQADGLESGEESDSEESDSRNGKHEDCELSGTRVLQHLEQDRTETAGDVSKEKEAAEEAQVLDEHQYLREKSLRRDTEPVKDEEEEKFESDKDKESSVESESDKEQQSQAVKEPVDHVHIQQEEKLVAEEDKCESGHERAEKETKALSVIEWAHIRPCLGSIEDMMCARVKNVKYMKNNQKTIVGDHISPRKESLPSIEESEQNCGENDRDSETSTSRSHSMKEDKGSVSPEPFFPWYEELEVLVRLGVPKDLRGEVWQAFVGVKARRVERYYQDLLAQIKWVYV